MDYVLAMYDIRGKQAFIFRTNKLKEIAGGSMVIEDLFNDYLFPAALSVPEDLAGCQDIYAYESISLSKKESPKSKGIYSYKQSSDEDTDFTETSFLAHMADGYIGEVVYDGGGNFILLFKSMEHFRRVTFLFTAQVMKKIGTLHVLATAVPIRDFSDYQADRNRLYEVHRRNENGESSAEPWGILPVTQVDRKTSMPLVSTRIDTGKVSKEAYAKLKKFYERGKKDEQYMANVKKFDDMVDKGVDSKIAVIYIDGNSMGARVQAVLGNRRTYEDCLKKLREFSKDIQKSYVTNGIESVTESLSGEKYRVVVAAGDEINFVVRASEALKCTVAYLTKLFSETDEKSERYSACAGITVFNSHAPYADAYSLAEQCCEFAKNRMKELTLQTACLIDFHMVQGAMGISLEQIREHEGTEHSSRPWLVCGEPDAYKPDIDLTDIQKIQELIELFSRLGRSNVKGLAEIALQDAFGLAMELRRIKAHLTSSGRSEEETKQIKEDLDEWIKALDSDSDILARKARMMIYDTVLCHDEWKGSFNQKKEEAVT